MAEVEYRLNLDSTKIPKVLPARVGGTESIRLSTISISISEWIARQAVL